MKKIVIIGAGGFIGSALKTFFEIGHRVFPVYRGDVNLLNHQEVRAFLLGVNPDVIINAYSAGGKSRVNDNTIDIVSENLIVFDNFRRCKHLFDRYINIGSGAEFEKEGICHEYDILDSVPKTSYGLSKNLISRLCLHEPNFYTLRLFGCFGEGEPDFRLFSKFMSGTHEFVIDDKYFDNISVKDFIIIMREYVINYPTHKDINCVPTKKMLISEQLKLLSAVTGHTRPLSFSRGKDYIGSSERLSSIGLPLNPLHIELEQYKCLK
jgi:dTDP-4-dehydrorhamnose reductase